ncbi:hypothetical protein GCM10007415_27550 [Parapedobacter pyrenivorans]|uniref:Uncharacterized protein n=1 Tax=Parapedobacter pyrenivorans TaxID=1305674 RepID=A0A917MDZ6_9SPHI|nr:hypothetical protein [Parapedobacter pyrenivorans]GGG91435.1 hypothetical protein GCM10007415_27550 [Parapedobacter pyrenivorans]
MKKSILSAVKASCVLGLFFMMSCAKTGSGPDDPDGPDRDSGGAIPNSLHIAFETPDWKRQIDCSHLDLNPTDAPDPQVVFVFASSESTRNTFMLSYPKYAGDLEKAGNIRRYPVAKYSAVAGPFQYAMKLPLDDDKLDVSYGRLESDAGDSETEFTEITEIKRVGTDGNYGVFQLKGRYGFHSTLVRSSGNEPGKYVKGTFHLKVRAQLD